MINRNSKNIVCKIIRHQSTVQKYRRFIKIRKFTPRERRIRENGDNIMRKAKMSQQRLLTIITTVVIVVVLTTTFADCSRYGGRSLKFQRPIHHIKDFISHRNNDDVRHRERRFIGPDADEAAKIRDMIFKVHQQSSTVVRNAETKAQLTNSVDKMKRNKILRGASL